MPIDDPLAGVNQPTDVSRYATRLALRRHHLLALAGVAAVLTIAFSLVPAGHVAANRQVLPLQLPTDDRPAVGPDNPEPVAWQDIPVKPGDNLSLILTRAGFDSGAVYAIVRQDAGNKLARLQPGETISLQQDENDKLLALRHTTSPLLSDIYRRVDDRYQAETLTRKPQISTKDAAATIAKGSSLSVAGQKAGLSAGIIKELGNIFGGVIDFYRDTRAGDSFYIVFESLYLDGKKYRDGAILAAEFVNRGKRYSAFRYIDENDRPGYFTEDGVSMRKAFLLAPLDFTRISSSFNPRRLHPIHRIRIPHRGTDYAAPRGTPVYAAGDGRVTIAGYNRRNGHYVVLQHGEQYTTKYLHLTRRKVKRGQRVKQQQIIGTVGATGAATGPHLHYEFLVDGVHRNPRTIHKKLPKASRLTAFQMPRFRKQTQRLRQQLVAEKRRRQLAGAGTHTNESTL